MRKILTSVLSVAGLLAVMLAIASGPATAQTAEVVTFTTDNIPGTYSVSWETQGGCDPTMRDETTSNATDGATGTYTRTVAVPAGTSPTAVVANGIMGEVAEFAVVTASHCTYTWDAEFASGLGGDKGTRCALAATPGNAVDGTRPRRRYHGPRRDPHHRALHRKRLPVPGAGR